jgi:hypothetical protein
MNCSFTVDTVLNILFNYSSLKHQKTTRGICFLSKFPVSSFGVPSYFFLLPVLVSDEDTLIFKIAVQLKVQRKYRAFNGTVS